MNIEKYSNIAPQYFANEAPKIIVDILQNNTFNHVLDCGCGDGSLLYYIHKYNLNKEAKVTGVDLSKRRVRIAKKISTKFDIFVDSAETLKTIKSKSVDLFITEQVIEHVDDKKMARAMARVTKQGSVIYLSTVHKKWYGWYFYHNEIGWVLDPTHLREYTSDNQLLQHFKSNFNVVLNSKSLQWFPVIDFFLKRLGLVNRMRDNFLWSLVRSIKVPIFGYYIWEIILIRK